MRGMTLVLRSLLCRELLYRLLYRLPARWWGVSSGLNLADGAGVQGSARL